MLRDEMMCRIETALLKLPRFPTEDDTRTVRRLVVEWAGQKQRAGWTPGQAIREMKACAAGVGLRCPARRFVDTPDPQTELLIDLVLWCIQGHFRQGEQGRTAAQMSA